MNNDNEQQSQCIYQDMTFATFHFFARIISSCANNLGRFDTLAIQTGSTRLGISSRCRSELCPELIFCHSPLRLQVW